MTTDEKIARHKEEIAKLQKEKKAERERQRRAHAKGNEKEVMDLLKNFGYNSMKEKSHENMIKYINKYSDKIMYFLEHGEVEKRASKSDVNQSV